MNRTDDLSRDMASPSLRRGSDDGRVHEWTRLWKRRLSGRGWADASWMSREVNGAMVADENCREAQNGPRDQHAHMSRGAGAVEVHRAAQQVRARTRRKQLPHPVHRVRKELRCGSHA